jgi:ElaB/YqjD/DUF883 family membrane-anchored ribosome-binding protein
MTELTASQREKLIADLRLVVSDAEELLKMTADEVSESAVGLRGRLQDQLNQARHRLLDLQATVTDGAKAAGRKADDYVHEHPWQSVAVGAGIGMLLGLLIARR